MVMQLPARITLNSIKSFHSRERIARQLKSVLRMMRTGSLMRISLFSFTIQAQKIQMESLKSLMDRIQKQKLLSLMTINLVKFTFKILMLNLRFPLRIKRLKSLWKERMEVMVLSRLIMRQYNWVIKTQHLMGCTTWVVKAN